jgi:hypothetical protein
MPTNPKLMATYKSSDRSVSFNIYMASFVDNTSGTVNSFAFNQPPSLDQLIKMLQSDSQLWSNLLHSSSHNLELL